VYCPNVVVGWWSGVRRRRLCVRCEASVDMCREFVGFYVWICVESLWGSMCGYV
jgi:hypothetical protein